MNKIINDFYPNKGQFLIEEEIQLVIEISNAIAPMTLSLRTEITHMDQVILSLERTVFIQRNDPPLLFTFPPLDIGGYGAKVIVGNGVAFGEICQTAFDVGKHPADFPRYGFLSDFTLADENDTQDILSMKKLHINLVQFYDWMYRHETLVSEEPNYTDLMGKQISRGAVLNKVTDCHKNGMKAIAYGAIYAASKPFYDEHSTWGLNNSHGKPITFIDIFYIMNISKYSPWHQHIINEYQHAIKSFDFDGIHMDTYGFPKSGYSNNCEQLDLIELSKEFPSLINDTKTAVTKLKKDAVVVFNNVGNWPVYATATTALDIVYIEVWEPYNTYLHIQSIIHNARYYTTKPIIISAYLKPFMYSTQEEAGYALKLMTACVISNGGTHLIMGENQGVLTQGYYVDYFLIENKLFGEIRCYYDFMVRYYELFYNQHLVDVSMTHAYGDNQEYIFKGAPCSPCAETGKIWTIIREDASTKLLSLINLSGNDNVWNEAKNKPALITELILEIQIEKEVKNVWLTSPDCPSLIDIPYRIKENDRGAILSLTIDALDIWAVIIIQMDH